MHQLDSITEFLQEKVTDRVFVKLDSRYADHFTEYSSYFGHDLVLLKYVYVITNSGKLFADSLTQCLFEAGFIQYQCQISIYYNNAPYGTNIVVLSYVNDCVYWYTSETIGNGLCIL